MMTPSDSASLLQLLSEAHGVSGFEDDVRAAIRGRLEPLGAACREDLLGNLVVTLPGAPAAPAPVLLLDAHMDEIGLVVSHVEPGGCLRFALVGGWDERVLPSMAVEVRTREGVRVPGVIGVSPPHIQKSDEQRKPYPADSLFIDVGAASAADAAALGICMGDSAAPATKLRALAGDTVSGKALDNRAGCAVLVAVLEHFLQSGTPPPVPLTAAFTTFEEIGARGAMAAAFGASPQVALVLEGTVAADVPGVPEARNPTVQGRGPALTLMDRSTHYSPAVTRFLERIAGDEGIPFQHKRPIFGGTDGARIHTTREGVATACVSVPCRYIHSAAATLRLGDFADTCRLAIRFTEHAAELAPLLSVP